MKVVMMHTRSVNVNADGKARLGFHYITTKNNVYKPVDAMYKHLSSPYSSKPKQERDINNVAPRPIRTWETITLPRTLAPTLRKIGGR